MLAAEELLAPATRWRCHWGFGLAAIIAVPGLIWPNVLVNTDSWSRDQRASAASDGR